MTVFFNDGDEMAKVLGINDANVPYLEFLLSSTLTTRGNQLTHILRGLHRRGRSLSPRTSSTWSGAR